MPRRADVAPVHDPRDIRQLLRDELAQRRESGYEVAQLAEGVARALAGREDPASWLDRLEATQRRSDWPYDEPTDLPDIVAALDADTGEVASIDEADLAFRLRGAWLGRCAGCMVGKPVEGWSRSEIAEYLTLAEAVPLRDYVPLIPLPDGLPPLKASWPQTVRGRVDGVARDDDIDYAILGLHLLETHGDNFRPEHVVAELVDHLPFTQVYTAERVAYRNIVDGLTPPATATHRNPYREWIGALIRADIFGYVAAGDPREAALLAYRDACTSHTENGIYASMWAAALISACFTTLHAHDAVRVAVRYVPLGSRLRETLSRGIESFDRGADWAAMMSEIDEAYGLYSWVHAIPNAAAIQAALLCSGDDHMTGVALAVRAGRDTDSTAATVGSALGALRGEDGVGPNLALPLHDLVRSAISSFDGIAISALAARTLGLAKAHRTTLAQRAMGTSTAPAVSVRAG